MRISMSIYWNEKADLFHVMNFAFNPNGYQQASGPLLTFSSDKFKTLCNKIIIDNISDYSRRYYNLPSGICCIEKAQRKILSNLVRLNIYASIIDRNKIFVFTDTEKKPNETPKFSEINIEDSSSVTYHLLHSAFMNEKIPSLTYKSVEALGKEKDLLEQERLKQLYKNCSVFNIIIKNEFFFLLEKTNENITLRQILLGEFITLIFNNRNEPVMNISEEKKWIYDMAFKEDVKVVSILRHISKVSLFKKQLLFQVIPIYPTKINAFENNDCSPIYSVAENSREDLLAKIKISQAEF